MNKQNQMEKKRKLIQSEENDDDEKQIEKTLNFFDSILDPYLTDQDENHLQNNLVNTYSSSSSSSSRYIPAPPQPHRRLERTPHVRRYTSENNLNKTPPSPTKPKLSRTRPLQTTTTSTEDLSNIPIQTRLSNFIKKTNQLSSNGASASLIDLSSIDKLSTRPRFRFVPPTNSNDILTEEPESEQQFHLKTISTNQTSLDYPTKSSHKIVKPIVITPSAPKSAPINRLTETNIHHQNGHSAFKPHQSSKNGVSSKIQQIKRTESIQKSDVHVGITNSDKSPLLRQPQFHQSMLNLSSPELVHKNRFPPRTSYQSNKTNGYHPSRPISNEDPIVRRIQQVNNTSSINGLVHQENRSQQQNYPYGSHISTTNGISPPMNKHRQQTYYNPPKYHSSQHPIPVQSAYHASLPVTRNNTFPTPPPPLPSSSNVYNFNQNHPPRDGQSKRHPHRQNLMITTYL